MSDRYYLYPKTISDPDCRELYVETLLCHVGNALVDGRDFLLLNLRHGQDILKLHEILEQLEDSIRYYRYYWTIGWMQGFEESVEFLRGCSEVLKGYLKLDEEKRLMKIEMFPVKNEGLGGLVVRNSSVTLYNDSGCALWTKEYHGAWEAQRGAKRLLDTLSRNPKITDRNQPRTLKHPHPYVPMFDLSLDPSNR